jgi:hypothetical protein
VSPQLLGVQEPHVAGHAVKSSQVAQLICPQNPGSAIPLQRASSVGATEVGAGVTGDLVTSRGGLKVGGGVGTMHSAGRHLARHRE